METRKQFAIHPSEVGGQQVRLIRGGVEFVMTVENLQELARGLPLVREVRDWDGQPIVVRVSLSGDRWEGLRVELWGVRDGGRSDVYKGKEWEKTVARVDRARLAQGRLKVVAVCGCDVTGLLLDRSG